MKRKLRTRSDQPPAGVSATAIAFVEKSAAPELGMGLLLGEGEPTRTLGTAVFSGMLGVTGFGLLQTPVFYSVILGLTSRKTAHRVPEAGPKPGAGGEVKRDGETPGRDGDQDGRGGAAAGSGRGVRAIRPLSPLFRGSIAVIRVAGPLVYPVRPGSHSLRSSQCHVDRVHLRPPHWRSVAG
jgi:hypothetical protein